MLLAHKFRPVLEHICFCGRTRSCWSLNSKHCWQASRNLLHLNCCNMALPACLNKHTSSQCSTGIAFGGSSVADLKEVNAPTSLWWLVPYSRKLSREKLLGILRFCGYTQEFSPRNLGHGVLWHCKSEQSTKVFSAKIVFSPICESFLPRKFPAIR